MSERVVLIDGSALIFRAFYALPQSFRTSSGLPTNATYGFALMFRKILEGRTPRFGAVVFDAPGPTFRDTTYPDYKANRPRMPSDLKPQLDWITKLVEAFGFPVLKVPGVEADDVIGTLTRQALEAGHEVRIVAPDKDFCQLIGPDVRMVDTMRDITYDPELVRKKWGVPPEQFVDLLALVGDKIDNIPGVPGIGQKGAAKLLELHGSLEGILANLEQIKGRARTALEEHAELARISKRLATIELHVPLDRGVEDLVLPEVDMSKVNALYRELEFFSLLSAEELGGEVTEDQGDFSAITSLDALRAFVAGIAEPVAVFPLFEPLNAARGRLVGLAIGFANARARYIAIHGQPGALGQPALDLLAPFLADPSRPKITHDLRDGWAVLHRHGIDLQGVIGDTRLGSFLLDPTGNIPHRLQQVIRQVLHRPLVPLKNLTGGGKSQKKLSDLSVEELTGWSGHVAAAIAEAWPVLEAQLDEANLLDHLHEVDLPLARVLGRMQIRGIVADGPALKALGEEFGARKEAIEAQIYETAGHTFNIGSTKQLSVVLFEELGLPVLKKTKTGYSTAADVLERLAPNHEIVRLILRWRALAKLINTYTRVLREAIWPQTGRIHATFQQTTGASGRIISTDPDLQRTPIRTEDGARLRHVFLAQPGWVMIDADWSQIELRLLAHITGDPGLTEAFVKGEDVHRRTASRIFEVAEDEVTPEQRNIGKTVNFATIYGQGATALGQQLGLKRSEAKRIIERYFATYAGVRSWIDETVAKAHETGFVTTLGGRRRLVPELSVGNRTQQAYGERIAANTPIQGSAADLCKAAMIAIDKEIRERGLQTRMLVQIHDELLFEAPPDELEDAVELIRRHMEQAWDLTVPLVVDVGWGKSWGEAH